MTSTAREQRGVRVRAGDRFVRGVEVVFVVAVDDRIEWTVPATGRSFKLPRAAFLGRALRRLAAPPALPEATDLLAAVWAVAGARQIDPHERLAIIARAFPAVLRTASPEERPILSAWLTALRTGVEPQQNPEVPGV